MPKPQNENRTRTTISISKDLKNIIRRYAEPATERKGNESDEQVLIRIVEYFKNHHPAHEGKPTYVLKTL